MRDRDPVALRRSIGYVPAIILSVLIAVPIGRLAFKKPVIGAPVLGAATLMYAIPALPLLIIIPALFGFALRSKATMVAALSIYGVALLVRTVADAFGAVDVRVLLSGVRVVTVSTISLVTIGALIGVPSLGSLLTDGFQRGIVAEVFVGIIMTALLALLLDGLLLLGGRLFAPWAFVKIRREKRS